MSKMKKACILFIVLLIVFSTKIFAVEDYDLSNKMRQEASEKALAQLMEKYKTDEVSEEQRILDYVWCGGSYDFSKESEGILSITINFFVTPYLEENSVWKKDFRNIAFAECSVVDGEYKIERVSLKPENYDKFLERFEEYEKNVNETIHVEAVAAEKTEELKSDKIEKMSNLIFISCSIIFTTLLIGILINVVKKFKSNDLI